MLRPCRYIMLLQMQHIPLGGSAVAQRSGDKALEQGMCAVGAALELRVELCTQMEVAAGQLHSLHQMTVRACAGNDQPGVLHLLPEVVVEFIAVAVALPDLALAVALGHLGAGLHRAGVLAQTHGTALGDVALLIRHQG